MGPLGGRRPRLSTLLVCVFLLVLAPLRGLALRGGDYDPDGVAREIR